MRTLFVAAALAVIACSAAAQSPQPPGPPMPYEDIGACPFECCTYREWASTSQVTTYTERNPAAPVAFLVAPRERVRALTGVVIAHQSSSNPMYGALGLELLASGLSPQQALDVMVRGDEGRNTRQVGIVDASGRTAAWTGPEALDWKGHQGARDFCAQGNILTGPDVVQAIARSFESSSGPLAERLVDALDAGQAAGGDARGMQAAALVIAKPLAGPAGFGDRAIDLRVDDHRAPLTELRRLLNLTYSRRLVGEANARLAQKDVAAASAAALGAREKSPENDEAWVVFAATELAAGRKASALDALRRAIELNPANKRQLPKNRAFESLLDDPAFKKLVS
jgi:uncharacterized Ntn-hydrolase superfamily protein